MFLWDEDSSGEVSFLPLSISFLHFFRERRVPISSFHASILADLFCSSDEEHSGAPYADWITIPATDRFRRGTDILRNALGEDMPLELNRMSLELHDSWMFQANIAGMIDFESESEDKEESSPPGQRRGVVIECDPLDDLNDFKIISADTTEFWNPDATYVLAYRGRVLVESQVHPLLIAGIFNIPSQSPDTINLLLQDYYSISPTEAVLFAAFDHFVSHSQDCTHEELLGVWGRIAFQHKMTRGFDRLCPALMEANGELPDCIQNIWEDWIKVLKSRCEIHGQFAEYLGFED